VVTKQCVLLRFDVTLFHRAKGGGGGGRGREGSSVGGKRDWSGWVGGQVLEKESDMLSLGFSLYFCKHF
jgi:hypothetical protein